MSIQVDPLLTGGVLPSEDVHLCNHTLSIFSVLLQVITFVQHLGKSNIFFPNPFINDYVRNCKTCLKLVSFASLVSYS